MTANSTAQGQLCNVLKLKIAFIINIVNAKFQEDEQLKTLAHKTSRKLKS